MTPKLHYVLVEGEGDPVVLPGDIEEALNIVEKTMAGHGRNFSHWSYTEEAEGYFLAHRDAMRPELFRRIMTRMYASTGA